MEPLRESGVQQIIRELAGAAEIGRRVHPREFRHSFITERYNRRMSPLALKDMVGHKSMAMIDRVYSHLKPADVYEEFPLGGYAGLSQNGRSFIFARTSA